MTRNALITLKLAIEDSENAYLIPRVASQDVITVLVRTLIDRSVTNKVLKEAIELLTVISATNEAYIIDRAILEGLLPQCTAILMASTNENACQILFSLSNVTAGTFSQIESVLSEGPLIERVINLA